MENQKNIRTKWQGLSKRKRLAVLAAIGIIIYGLLGVFAGPPIMQSILVEQVHTATGRSITLDDTSFNPFTLKLTLRGLNLMEADGSSPFVSAEEIQINLSGLSGFRLAAIMDELRLKGPVIHLTRKGQGLYNFSDLVGTDEQAQNATEPEPSKDGLLPFVVHNLVIENGTITFDDEPLGTSHQIENIELGVPFASSLPGDITEYVEPYLRMTVDSTPFSLDGRTLPFDDTLRTEFELALDGYDLRDVWPYLPIPKGLSLERGGLRCDLDLVFERPKDGGLPSLFAKGTINMDALHLAHKGAKTLQLANLLIEVERFSLTKRLLRLNLLRLKGLELDVKRAANGDLEIMELVPVAQAKDEAPADEEQAPFTVQAVQIELDGGQLVFTDNAAGGFSKTISLNADIANLDTAGGIGQFDVALQTTDKETVSLQGDFTLDALAANGTLSVADALLPSYAPYYRQALPLRLASGTAWLRTNFDYALAADGNPGRTRTTDTALGLDTLSLFKPEAKAPSFQLKSFQAQGGRIDALTQSMAFDSINATAGNVALERDKQGVIDLAALLSPKESDTAAPTPETKAKPWRVQVARTNLQEWRATFADRGIKTPTTLAIPWLNLNLAHVDSALKEPLGYTLATGFGPKGRVDLNGTLSPKMQTKGTIKVRRIPLSKFGPYLADASALTIRRGGFALTGTYDIALADEPTGHVGGNVGVYGLSVGAGKHELLGLKSLVTKKISATLKPLAVKLDTVELEELAVRDPQETEAALELGTLQVGPSSWDSEARALDVATIDITAPGARLNVDKQGITNLARIIALAKGEPAPQPKPKQTEEEQAQEEEKQPEEKPETAEAAPEAQAPQAEPGPTIRLHALTLTGGWADLRDESVSPTFTSGMQDLQADLTNLSTVPGEQAALNVSAMLDGHAPLTITGAASPTDIGLNPHATLAIKGLNLTHLSPYFVKHLAYPVTRGKFSTNIDVDIQGKDLKVDNNLFIGLFELGKQVDSPDALDVPVGLAVALLRDGNGDISLDVPVRGRTDDPDFRLGGVIIKAIVNALIKVVTSPFALIGSLFGGGEDLDSLTMPQGRALLDQAALDKLDTLAKALADRPGLRLEIQGHSDAAELPALADVRFMHAVKAMKFREMQDDGEAPANVDMVTFEDDEFEDYLEEAWDEAPFEKESNFIGLTASQEPEVMEQQLREYLAPTQDNLVELANERARLARDYLVEKGQVSADRVYLLEQAPTEGDTPPGVVFQLQ